MTKKKYEAKLTIKFEGPVGCGKSTIMHLFERILKEKGCEILKMDGLEHEMEVKYDLNDLLDGRFNI